MNDSRGNISFLRKAVILSIAATTAWFLFGSSIRAGQIPQDTPYRRWVSVGKQAAEEALDIMRKSGFPSNKKKLIAMTNAGYAEVNGQSTQPALDGLSRVTGASRGATTLVEIHSNSQCPLWFAVFDACSGACAYLQVRAGGVKQDKNSSPGASSAGLFDIHSIARIDADYLFANPAEYTGKFEQKIFGGNEFRIIAIANAIARGAPASVIRAVEFHDHYCPGVTSGILMAAYVKKNFPADGAYFIHAVDPWCKEDALMVLLNVTPGKQGYAVFYPSEADKVKRLPEAKNASTIIYRQNLQTKRWEGRVLAFEWAETTCPKSGNVIIDKLCADLWYLDRLDQPEAFVKVLREFDLPDGVTPKDWARPGIDPLGMAGMLLDPGKETP
ncbi:MAG: FmdE family protein [Pseudomonadota bacterium]